MNDPLSNYNAAVDRISKLPMDVRNDLAMWLAGTTIPGTGTAEQSLDEACGADAMICKLMNQLAAMPEPERQRKPQPNRMGDHYWGVLE